MIDGDAMISIVPRESIKIGRDRRKFMYLPWRKLVLEMSDEMNKKNNRPSSILAKK